MTQTPPTNEPVTPPANPPATPPETVITLTPAQLADRLARATKPYEDYDTIKSQLAELQKTQETDLQRVAREAQEAAEARVPELVSQQVSGAQKAMIKAELRSQATVLGFKYPEDVITLLAENSEITVGEDYAVKGVEKLVKELAEKRPEWLTRQQFNGAPPRNGGTPPGNPGEETPEARALRERHRRSVMGMPTNTI